MNVDKIRAYHLKRPFVPFVLHMADGRSVRVDSHEFMWIIPGGRHIHVWQPNEDIHFIDTLLVTSLTY